MKRREVVFGTSGGAEVDCRAGPVAQLQVAGHEVCMKVRQKHMPDVHAVLVRERQVLIDVSLGIDNRRGMRLFVGNDVGRMGEAV